MEQTNLDHIRESIILLFLSSQIVYIHEDIFLRIHWPPLQSFPLTKAPTLDSWLLVSSSIHRIYLLEDGDG